MKLRSIPACIVLALIWIGMGCSDGRGFDADEKRYQAAIIDAITAEWDEIYDGLIPVVESNDDLFWTEIDGEKSVLVVTWTAFPESYVAGEIVQTWWGDTWVTVVPEIIDWFTVHDVAMSRLDLRTEQLLGLPKDSGYTHFIELWVKPEDLFRPSPDREITDRICRLNFPPGTESWYKKWFDDNAAFSYTPSGYPWTRLGYTYDWGSDISEIGLSEFVIQKDADVLVEAIIPTATYLLDNASGF